MRAFYFRNMVAGVLVCLLAACSSSGAVRFAPTPIPPDSSPLRYEHPSGAFSVELPRAWALFERNAVTLAAASFSPPGADLPPLRMAAVKLPEAPADGTAITAIMNDYQQRVRTDVGRYSEQSREAMGDGSWRMTGLRQQAGSTVQQVNTFMQFNEATVGVIEIVLTDDAALNDALQRIINTVQFTDENRLESAQLNTLAFASSGTLEALNVHSWEAPNGAFYITGEVANYTGQTLVDIPVQVVLYTVDGRAITEAVDTVMGHGIAPGGFAPFSLRFGDGQPPLTMRYDLTFGAADWQPEPGTQLFSNDVLSWTDDAEFTEDGLLVISGELTNTSGSTYVYSPRASVTVFDDQQRIIAAGFHDIDETEIEPGEAVPFEMLIPEIGGTPDRYILNVQGLP
ncbi:MAG: FxLYD domain-containing protein [Chloroflexota bacterium]